MTQVPMSLCVFRFKSPPVYKNKNAHIPAHAHTLAHTHISSSIANLTASWYFIKIKYSEPNISAPASVSPLAFAVLLLAVIKQRCIAAGAPFWIGGELPVFVVRHHAPNRDACTVTVRYEYMYRATPNISWSRFAVDLDYQVYLFLSCCSPTALPGQGLHL